MGAFVVVCLFICSSVRLFVCLFVFIFSEFAACYLMANCVLSGFTMSLDVIVSRRNNKWQTLLASSQNPPSRVLTLFSNYTIICSFRICIPGDSRPQVKAYFTNALHSFIRSTWALERLKDQHDRCWGSLNNVRRIPRYNVVTYWNICVPLLQGQNCWRFGQIYL